MAQTLNQVSECFIDGKCMSGSSNGDLGAFHIGLDTAQTAQSARSAHS